MSGDVAILYFSGTGGTAIVARLLAEAISERLPCAVAEVYDPRSRALAGNARFLVFCYPTYYLRPAPSMREFIASLPRFEPPRSAFVVTTYELYSENSLRACALMLKDRGIMVVGWGSVRAPGSDVTLVLPERLCPWLYLFEKGLGRKLASLAEKIGAAASEPAPASASALAGRIPAPKWYTPFAQLLQIALLNHFDLFRSRLRALGERCDGCGACAAACDRKAWRMEDGHPVLESDRCELCGRCLHRCPRRAIVLIAALKDNRRLDGRLYAALEVRAREEVALARGRGGDDSGRAAGDER
ncbi:MAG: EFR1 family ferrodoxin [Spirochaetaceae bacterium]|nr:EFR1 family ferrodoxin [Spirochaetaceae bacterium]